MTYNLQSLIEVAAEVLARDSRVTMLSASTQFQSHYPALHQPSNEQWADAFLALGLIAEHQTGIIIIAEGEIATLSLLGGESDRVECGAVIL